MGNNKSKKVRRIIVNDTPFAWRVGDFNSDGDYSVFLSIYKDKKLIYKAPISTSAITPKTVEGIIKNFLTT